MLGTIALKNLKITCIIGIHPKERDLEQNLFLDLEIHYDMASPSTSENIKDTLDYSELAGKFEAWVKENKFQLIETLAYKGCDFLFATWPKIAECTIRVKKPGAVPQADYASVSLTKQNLSANIRHLH